MLRQRIITALIIAISLLCIVLWAPAQVTLAVLAGMVLIGAWEWSAFLRTEGYAPRVIYVLAIVGATALGWLYSGSLQAEYQLLAASAIWWAIAFTWVAWFPSRVNSRSAAIAGLLVLAPAGIALGRLEQMTSGPTLILFLFVMVAATDIGAFLVGRKLGRLKLAPRVSPGKTWEGVLGGFALASLVAVAGAVWLKWPVLPFLIVCALVIVGSIVGDLTESLFKRYAGLKDSGTLLPGHGGILDRIDSMTAAAPLFLLGLHWLGIRS